MAGFLPEYSYAFYPVRGEVKHLNLNKRPCVDIVQPFFPLEHYIHYRKNPRELIYHVACGQEKGLPENPHFRRHYGDVLVVTLGV